MKNRILALSFLLIASAYISPKCFALDFATIRTLSRALARDPIPTSGAPRISEVMVSSYTNIAMQEIVSYTWCLEDTVSYSTVVGQREYTLPSDFIAIQRLTIDNTLITATSISKLDINDSSWVANITTGTPSKYYLNPGLDVFGFDSIPSTTTDHVISINYIKQPPMLVNDTDIPFDSQNRLTPYHYTICLWVASMMCYTDNRPTEGDRYYAMYVDRVKNMATSIRLSGDYYPNFGGSTGGK